MRRYADVKTLKLIYYSLAFPHLQYCVSCWGAASRSSLLTLIRKQKLLARAILNQDFHSPSKPLFLKLQILNIDQIYKYRIGLLMHKNKIGEIQLPQKLTKISEIHSYNTRSNSYNNYFVPPARLNLSKNSFSFSGPFTWNGIPLEIRSVTNFTFKNKYRTYLLNS